MTERALRILDIRDSPWFDGPGRTVLEVAQGLAPRGYEIIVGSFLSPDRRSEHAYLNEARRRGLPTFGIEEDSAFDRQVVGRLRRFIRDEGIDAIHAHEFRSNVFALWAARLEGVAAVATVHGWIQNDWRGRAYTFADKLLMHGFDEVVAVSSIIRDQLRRVGVSASKISVVHNTLRTAEFRPDRDDRAFRRELGLPEGCTLLGKIGRLSAEKGQSDLVSAIAALADRGFDVHLALVGVGPDEASLREQVVERGVADKVSFLGFRTDMGTIYNSLDGVVQTSYTEGMPNVILEAMAMEVPIVATPVGGTTELISPDVHGRLFAPGDVDGLVHALEALTRDAAGTRRMVWNAAQRVRSEFDSETRLVRMGEVYERVAQRRRRRNAA